jgi:rSAM/selenodomain-associated transferase 1
MIVMTVRFERIIILTRYPVAGKTKTRLIPRLGPDGAVRLHRQMAEWTVKQMKAVEAIRGTSVEVRFEGGDEDLMLEWLGPVIRFRPQGDGDLGERMKRAFAEAFEEGCKSVIAVGTDCPGLTSGLMEYALNLVSVLDEDGVLLGPSRDGGYYLIGLRRLHSSLFHDCALGCDLVLRVTLEIAANLAGC